MNKTLLPYYLRSTLPERKSNTAKRIATGALVVAGAWVGLKAIGLAYGIVSLIVPTLVVGGIGYAAWKLLTR